MILRCDLHIHTALSPCGDMDMTPNNIVNMAQLKGLDRSWLTADEQSPSGKATRPQAIHQNPDTILPDRPVINASDGDVHGKDSRGG